MAPKQKHECKYFKIDGDGNLVCADCGQPSRKNQPEEPAPPPPPPDDPVYNEAGEEICPSCGQTLPVVNPDGGEGEAGGANLKIEKGKIENKILKKEPENKQTKR